MLFNWEVTGAYYKGRKENTAGYSYTYPAYVLVHGYAGIALRVHRQWLAALGAGPGLGIYNGNTRYNTGVQAAVHYALSDRFHLSPSFRLMQEPGTNWLGALGLRVVVYFEKKTFSR